MMCNNGTPLLYLILIHHQTTTSSQVQNDRVGCISSLFITKPQHLSRFPHVYKSCISSLFITKPQHDAVRVIKLVVVSHPYSSPNHNPISYLTRMARLYLILIHHQTTTGCYESEEAVSCISSLFITKPQHEVVANVSLFGCISSLFITKPQQDSGMPSLNEGCISSLFITKPQLEEGDSLSMRVVSHPYSSPNHNAESRRASTG